MPITNGENNTPSSASDEDVDSSQGRDSALQSPSGAQPLTLSSDQIISILEQEPDLLMELKSQLADRLQQQGVEIDPAGITDQAFYSQISTSAELRTSITAVLRARGTLSDEDLQSFRSGGSSDADQNGSSSAQRSPSSDNGASAVQGLVQLRSAGEGIPGTEVNGAPGGL